VDEAADLDQVLGGEEVPKVVVPTLKQFLERPTLVATDEARSGKPVQWMRIGFAMDAVQSLAIEGELLQKFLEALGADPQRRVLDEGIGRTVSRWVPHHGVFHFHAKHVRAVDKFIKGW